MIGQALLRVVATILAARLPPSTLNKPAHHPPHLAIAITKTQPQPSNPIKCISVLDALGSTDSLTPISAILRRVFIANCVARRAEATWPDAPPAESALVTCVSLRATA
jgi:hypothetical protein